MRKGYRKNTRRSKKGISFNPSKDYVNKAVEEYLGKGGKITKVDDVTDDYEHFIAQYQSTGSADSFLMGM